MLPELGKEMFPALPSFLGVPAFTPFHCKLSTDVTLKTVKTPISFDDRSLLRMPKLLCWESHLIHDGTLRLHGHLDISGSYETKSRRFQILVQLEGFSRIPHNPFKSLSKVCFHLDLDLSLSWNRVLVALLLIWSWHLASQTGHEELFYFPSQFCNL